MNREDIKLILSNIYALQVMGMQMQCLHTLYLKGINIAQYLLHIFSVHLFFPPFFVKPLTHDLCAFVCVPCAFSVRCFHCPPKKNRHIGSMFSISGLVASANISE